MKQFVLPPDYTGESELSLTGRDFHYLHRVRRMQPGDSFRGRAHDGSAYRLTVTSVGQDHMQVRVEAWESTPEERASDGRMSQKRAAANAGMPSITLFQCLPKGKKLDQIVRQATEAGVQRIVPVASTRAVKRLEDPQRARRRLERWQRIAEEAVQQSGRSDVPAVEPVRDLTEVPSVHNGNGEAAGLAFHEKALAAHSIGGYLSAGPRRVALVIGPEGGLTDEEASTLGHRGFNLVSLGPRVLRTETAAVYAIAAVQSVYRELVAWRQAPT